MGYASKTLPEACSRYSVTELDMAGLLVNMNLWKNLLKHREFDAAADHVAVAQIMKAKTEPATTRMMRLLDRLSAYSFNLYYVKGRDLILSDYLSRHRQKDDGCYHPIAFGSCSLTPSKKNYHSSKLEFLTLKWSITEHFKEYLAYALFVVCMDNNPLMYILTTPNLDATGHRWLGVLASFEFTLEYQKGADNGAADALSQVPICHNCKMVKSLLEGALIAAPGRGKAEAGEGLLCEHVCLENEAHIKVAKLASMHVVDCGEVQEADAVLAACHQWLKTHKDTPLPKRDVLLKQYLGCHTEMEEGHALFCVQSSLVLNKGVMYSLGGLVFCHYHQGIPHEMVCNQEDVLHYQGLIQLHCGLYAGVV